MTIKNIFKICCIFNVKMPLNEIEGKDVINQKKQQLIS